MIAVDLLRHLVEVDIGPLPIVRLSVFQGCDRRGYAMAVSFCEQAYRTGSFMNDNRYSNLLATPIDNIPLQTCPIPSRGWY